MLLHSANGALHFGHVTIVRDNVESQLWKSVPKAFELIVHVKYRTKECTHGRVGAVVNRLGVSESQVS